MGGEWNEIISVPGSRPTHPLPGVQVDKNCLAILLHYLWELKHAIRRSNYFYSGLLVSSPTSNMFIVRLIRYTGTLFRQCSHYYIYYIRYYIYYIYHYIYLCSCMYVLVYICMFMFCPTKELIIHVNYWLQIQNSSA